MKIGYQGEDLPEVIGPRPGREKQYYKAIEQLTELFKDGENIVSPKIYEALDHFNKMKDDIVKSPDVKGKIREAHSFLSTAVNLRISGIKQHSDGYYKKESDYDGEYEKGRAKIRLADDNYVDFIILLQEVGMGHRSVFDDLIRLYLEYNLEYYR